MDWLSNICGCISPQLQNTIVSYLNSNQLNEHNISEQKSTEKYEQVPVKQSIYDHAKSKSYSFHEMQDNNDDESNHIQNQQEKAEDQNQQEDHIIDSFWYPNKKFIKNSTKTELLERLYNQKRRLLKIILSQHPNTMNYDKIYDSQDQLNLVIYCKLETPLASKRINVYRFSFVIVDLTMSDYENWIKDNSDKPISERKIENLLQSGHLIQQNEELNIRIQKRNYKKVLVIGPHSYITAIKTSQEISQGEEQEQEQNKNYYLTTMFSVKDNSFRDLIEEQTHNLGWLNLCGLSVSQKNEQQTKYLKFEGYLNVQLNISLSPNMLKQPIAKQIRIFVQKLSCAIKNSDEL